VPNWANLFHKWPVQPPGAIKQSCTEHAKTPEKSTQ